MIGAATHGGRGMEPGVPEPPAVYERFTVTYPSGTVIPSFYTGGATLIEVRVAHPLAVVEAVEDFRRQVCARRHAQNASIMASVSPWQAACVKQSSGRRTAPSPTKKGQEHFNTKVRPKGRELPRRTRK
jgi:hypothetical protein